MVAKPGHGWGDHTVYLQVIKQIGKSQELLLAYCENHPLPEIPSTVPPRAARKAKAKAKATGEPASAPKDETEELADDVDGEALEEAEGESAA